MTPPTSGTNPPRSIPVPVSSVSPSPSRVSSNCRKSTRGRNCARTIYGGYITERSGANQSSHCTAKSSLYPPQRTTSCLLSSSCSSSSSRSKFDPARLDCLRRHENLRRKREAQMQVIRAKEDLARNFKARPLPPIHRGASFVEPDKSTNDVEKNSAIYIRPFMSMSSSNSSIEDSTEGGSPSSSYSRYCTTGAGSTFRTSPCRKATSPRATDSGFLSPQCQDNNDEFGRSIYMLEDGIGLLQRQREWADSRERRLEAARVVKAVEEVAVCADLCLCAV